MVMASVSDGVFLGDGGVFQECCCHVAFLSIKRASGAESIIFAVEDMGDEGRVMWTKEISPVADVDTFTSLWSHGGNLYLAIRPASPTDPSIFKIKESNGSTLASLALTTIDGGLTIKKPGIAVNTSGQVFVVADRSDVNYSRDCFRLGLDLSVQLSVKALSLTLPPEDPHHGFLDAPFNAFGLLGRQRILTVDSGGAPCISGSGNCGRLNTDFTNPYDPTTWQWFTADAPLEPIPGGFAPSVHRGGPDVLIALANTSPVGQLVNCTSYGYAKTFVSSVRGTFANTRVNGFGSGFAWVPQSTTEIVKVNLGGGAGGYVKTLGVDFLTDGTWGESTSRLDVLRHNDGTLWILARDTDAGNLRAVLLLVEEDGTDWTERWQLDLIADDDVDWSNPGVADHWRGWVLNTPGQGWDG